MPELEKLELFNQELIRHGDEPSHAVRRGEEIERPLTPEEYPLNNRPQGVKTNRAAAAAPGADGGAAAAGGAAGAAGAAGASTDDFLSSLDPDLFGGTADKADSGSTPGGFDDLFDSDLLAGLPGKTASTVPAGAGDDQATPSFDDLFDASTFDDLPGPGVDDVVPADDGGEVPAAGLAPSEPEALETGLDDLAGLDLGDSGDAAETGESLAGPADESGLGGLEAETAEEAAGGVDDDFLSGLTDDFFATPADADETDVATGPAVPPADATADLADMGDLGSSAPGGADDGFGDLGDLGNLDLGDEYGDLGSLNGDAAADGAGAASSTAEAPAAAAGQAGRRTDSDTFGLDDLADLGSNGSGGADDGFGDLGDLGNLDLGDEYGDLGGLGGAEAADGAGAAEPEPLEESLDMDLPADEDLHPLDDTNEFHVASEQFDADVLSPAAEPAAGSAMPDMPPDFGANMDMDFGTDSFSDEFDMSDFGKDFGLMEEIHEEAWTAPAAPEAAKEAPKPAGKKPNIVAEAEEEIQRATLHEQAAAFDIGEENLGRIQQTLSAMPLNLKVATEELLGDENIDFDALKNLINVLVRGESPRDIAPIVSRLSGKKIKIPAGYEKRTGTAFEQERRSFAYRFRHVIFPVLRVVALASALAALLIYGAYEFIYKPVYGNSLYDKGLEAIRQDEYAQGNELFERAWGYLPDTNRYVQYAQAFRGKRQDALATQKYQTLLGLTDPRAKPRGIDRLHRAGLLDYADFLAWTRRDYSTAVTYLQRLVDLDKFDHVPVVLQGDVFLEWARYVLPGRQIEVVYSDKVVKSGDQALLLELARYNYASLISREGQTDELLSRMLRYFMRTGKEDEVIKIKNLFLKDPDAKPDGAVTAELAGFLIDAAEGNVRAMEEPYRLLIKSIDAGFDREPGLHYQLSRYFRTLKDEAAETKALDWAVKTFDERLAGRPLDRFEQIQYIDTLIRQGERLYGPLYSKQNVMDAQAMLQKARDLYERSLQTGHIPETIPLLGRVYARLGDILYYNAGDLGGAWRQYSIARKHGYGLASPDAFVQVRPRTVSYLERADAGIPHLSIAELIDASQDVSYKMGFIHYYLSWTQKARSREQGINQDLALSEFTQAAGAIPLHNLNLQYALANVQYLRGNFDAAVSGYQQILERLELERDKIPELQIYDNNSHRELVEFLVRTHNNLGVSLYRLYRQGGPVGSDYRGQAMYHIGRALEVYENAAREPETAIRAERKSQAYQNLRAMLKSDTEDDLSISWELRQDLSQSEFSRDLLTINQQSKRSQNLFP